MIRNMLIRTFKIIKCFNKFMLISTLLFDSNPKVHQNPDYQAVIAY